MRDGRAALLATAACVAAAACWAMNAVIAAGAFDRGVTPEQLAQARVTVALIPLAAYLVVARRDLLVPPRAARPALVGFGMSMVIVNFAYYVAIDRVPVGVAISLQYTAPVLILAGTAIVTGRVPAPVIWAAGMMTLGGAVLVSGVAGGGVAGALDPVGIGAGVVSALSFAGYLVTAELAGRRGSRPATTLLNGFVVAVIVWILLLPPWSWPLDLLAEPDVAWRVAAVGLLGTLLPFALTVAALRWITSAVAGIATTTEPVLAAALAWLFLGQSLAPMQLVGGALVVGGVLAAQLARRPMPSAAPVEIAP